MKRWIAMLFVLSALLSGCVNAPNNIESQVCTQATVEDVFTQPTVTTPVTTEPNDIEPTVPDGTEATKPSVSIPMGGMGFGIKDEKKQIDEFGSFYVYEGGQMCLRFMLQTDGRSMIDCVENGIGIQLMLDGQPQPYRTSPDGELAYFHVFYPDFDVEGYGMTQTRYIDLYFTPVAGKKGESVEFYATTIRHPDYQTSEPFTGFVHTFGALQVGTRLKLEETPPGISKPDVTERIHSVDISYADTSYADIAGWSDSDLIEKYDYDFKINGQPYPGMTGNKIYDVSADKQVELTFEVWGTPYVKYGLMFYVDNQPISATEVIHFSMKNGQKTVITVMMDLSDFDGEAVIYAALIPRNCRTTEIMTMAFLIVEQTYYMVDDPLPEK